MWPTSVAPAGTGAPAAPAGTPGVGAPPAASAGGAAHGAAAAAASGGALCAGSSGSCSQAYLPSAGLDAAAAGQAYQGGLVADAAHAVYLCDPRTEDECLARSLLGLPASQAQVVRGIVPEQSLLFLFNVRARPPPCPRSDPFHAHTAAAAAAGAPEADAAPAC